MNDKKEKRPRVEQMRKSVKMPSKVFYNLDHMMSPKNGDPKSNIYMGSNDKNRIARDRYNISP